MLLGSLCLQSCAKNTQAPTWALRHVCVRSSKKHSFVPGWGGESKRAGGGESVLKNQDQHVLMASDKWLLFTESQFPHLHNAGDMGLSRLKKESNEVTKKRDVCERPRPDL